MGINIEDNGTPDPDVGGERNPNNPDTYESTDDNGSSFIQV